MLGPSKGVETFQITTFQPLVLRHLELRVEAAVWLGNPRSSSNTLFWQQDASSTLRYAEQFGCKASRHTRSIDEKRRRSKLRFQTFFLSLGGFLPCLYLLYFLGNLLGAETVLEGGSKHGLERQTDVHLTHCVCWPDDLLDPLLKLVGCACANPR